MATLKVHRLLIWMTLTTCISLCFSSPTRRQFVSITETTSSDPAALATIDGTSWDDSDEDFDLEGGGWLKEETSSPSSISQSPDYDDYDADDDEEEVVQQDSEENNSKRDSEFLFLPPTDTRLLLEDDDDDQPGLIKVRHTSKSSYAEPQEGSDNSVETEVKRRSDDQFVFTLDGDDDDFDGSDNKVDGNNDDDNDFMLDDSEPKIDKNEDKLPRKETREDDDDDDDLVDDEDDDDTVFDSPEEDAQVIYGDNVFLY